MVLWLVYRLAVSLILICFYLFDHCSAFVGRCGSWCGWGFEVDFNLLAGVHGDGEWDGFEAGDEVEGSFFGDGCEALRGGGA